MHIPQHKEKQGAQWRHKLGVMLTIRRHNIFQPFSRTLVKHLFNGSVTPAPCMAFHSPPGPKSLENSWQEVLSSGVAQTQRS